MISVAFMIAYLNAMDDYYDLIAPQFYNQDGGGLWVQEANGGKGALIAQNNKDMKEEVFYYLCESLVTGTRGFTKNALDRFDIGLPANAAATGYVVNPMAITSALMLLDAKGFNDQRLNDLVGQLGLRAR